MLRKWLLSSSMVTESRFCQEMLIEGQILDNSIRHCFHNCLHPPSWTLSPLKRRGVLQLLFLAKAASHKLYYNYRSDDDFYHLGHLGHTWSWPSTFKLSVKGRIHTHLSLTPSHLPASFFFCHSDLLLVPPPARQQHPSHDRCWADIKPAVFCFQVRRVSKLVSRQNLAPFKNRVRIKKIYKEINNFRALGIISLLFILLFYFKWKIKTKY